MAERRLRLIGWWQIACGTLGVLMFAANWLNLLPNGRAWVNGTLGFINFELGLTFFMFAIATGRGLLRSQPWAIPASLVCQVVQIVSFTILNGPSYEVRAGPFLGVTISDTIIAANVAFNAAFFLGTLIAGPAFTIKINFLALGWSVALLRHMRSQRRVVPAPAV